MWLPLLIFIYLIGRLFLPRNASLPSDFELLCRTSFPRPKEQTILDYGEFKKQFLEKDVGAGVDKFFLERQFSNLILRSIEDSEFPCLKLSDVDGLISFDVNWMAQKGDFKLMQKPNKGKNFHSPHLDDLVFENTKCHENYAFIRIKGAIILKVLMQPSYRGKIIFEDCWIFSLNLKEREASENIRLTLINCHVSSLVLESNSCSSLEVRGGSISQIISPASHLPSPIRYLFEANDESAFFLDEIPKNQEGVVNYRSLLHHIRSTSSPFTQQLLNAAILKMDRKNDPRFLRLANYFYNIFSGYNTKPGLPLIWSLIFFGVCIYISLLLDLSVSPKSCSMQEVSWVNRICGDDFISKVGRSFVLIVNAFLNPFGIFSESSFLKSNSFLFSVFLLISGLLNILWIALAVFSIKTRFTAKSNS